jgi:phosphonate degradation associated HDIG domain protein
MSMSASFVDEVFQAFADRGADFYGENVSQLDHAMQCAFLASDEGASDRLIAAALLHDIGHLFEGRGEVAEREGRDARHEAHGARMLKQWLGPDVAGPVALHVAAKRYLCATEPGYEQALSPASRLSLELQGGRFTAEEQAVFERSPFAADAVRLRRWDDAGKIPDLVIPGLEHYRPLLERLAVV